MQTIFYSWPFWAYFREFSSLLDPEDSYTILLSRFDLRVSKKDLTTCSIRAEQKIDAFPPFNPCFSFQNVVVITIIRQLLQIVRPSKEKQLKGFPAFVDCLIFGRLGSVGSTHCANVIERFRHL
jgi:hypothetical protein